MIRGADLEKALRDLRPTYVALRKAEADLKKDVVSGTMNVRAAVESQRGAARGIIGDRAKAMAIEPDALTAILAASATLQKRLGRKPSIRQITAYCSTQQAGHAKALPRAEQDAIDAAEHAEAVRKRRDVWSAACAAVTGYPD